MIPGYQLVRRDRDRHGGGIALYVRDHLSLTVKVSHPEAVLLLIELRLRRSCLLCGLLYRPPSSSASILSSVESTLEQLLDRVIRRFHDHHDRDYPHQTDQAED